VSTINASVNALDTSCINLGWIYGVNCQSNDKRTGRTHVYRYPGASSIGSLIARTAAILALQWTDNRKVPRRCSARHVSIAEYIYRDARAIFTAAAAKICGVNE